MNAKDIIAKLPLNADRKLRLFKQLRGTLWRCKYSANLYNELVAQQPLVPQNYYYGHEYWLKQYSGYNNYVFGLIEHGLHYKEDTSKDGWDVEWDVGSILTFGEARYETLTCLYPDYNIYKIGPRIHYSPVDERYYNELLSEIDPYSKTMVLYPAHSIASYEYKYDVELFVSRALDFAKEHSIKNIMVSLHPSDILHGYQHKYKEIDNRLILVTGGTNQERFLPRLKAILSLADITYSNLVGTHVGYSIYMNKPHIIDSTSDNIDSKSYMNLSCEKENELLFAKVFNGDNPWVITKEQYELVDYNFGLSHVKEPEKMYNILENCEATYKKRFGLL